MNAVTLFLIPAVSVYTLAVLGSWLIATLRIHGVIYDPAKSFRVFKPVIIAFCAGFFPAAILSAILMPRLPENRWIALLIFAAGLLITGLMSHRDLLKQVRTPRIWNTAIAGE